MFVVPPTDIAQQKCARAYNEIGQNGEFGMGDQQSGRRDQDARTTALAMFRSGASKAKIAAAIGKDKKQVGRILAEAINEHSNGGRI